MRAAQFQSLCDDLRNQLYNQLFELVMECTGITIDKTESKTIDFNAGLTGLDYAMKVGSVRVEEYRFDSIRYDWYTGRIFLNGVVDDQYGNWESCEVKDWRNLSIDSMIVVLARLEDVRLTQQENAIRLFKVDIGSDYAEYNVIPLSQILEDFKDALEFDCSYTVDDQNVVTFFCRNNDVPALKASFKEEHWDYETVRDNVVIPPSILQKT